MEFRDVRKDEGVMRRGAWWLLPAVTVLALLALAQPDRADAGTLKATAVSAGWHTTCAVQKDTRQPLCWGLNLGGQVGDGSTINREIPSRVYGLGDGKGLEGDLISTEAGTSCVSGPHPNQTDQSTNNVTACWGANVLPEYKWQWDHFVPGFQVGRVPVPVNMGSPVRQIDVGQFKSGPCVIRDIVAGMTTPACVSRVPGGDGDYLWEVEDVPSLVRAERISVGWNSACAIHQGNPPGSTRYVVCWGNNDDGQLGDGTRLESDTRVQVKGVGGVGTLDDGIEVTVGNEHACAIRDGGQAVCWGSQSNSGLLGDGGIGLSTVPVNVQGLADAVAISAGSSHTCAIRDGGQAVCWGNNGDGQLGDGSAPGDPTYTHSRTPVNVQGLTDAVAISAGDDHTCAIRANDEVVCWGANESGELGDATTDASRVPTPVTDQLVDQFPLTVETTGNRYGGIVVSDLYATMTDQHPIFCGGFNPDDPNEACSTDPLAEGSVVTLGQVAREDSVFTGWSGDGAGCGTAETCTVTMDQARTVKANFELKPNSLTVKTAGSGSGDTTADAEAPYEWGQQVAVTATPDAGSTFAGWQGCESVEGRVCTVTMKGDVTVTARFTRDSSGPPKPPNGNTATYDPATGRLAFRLRCPARFRPRCDRAVGQAVSSRGKAAKKMSSRVTVRKIRGNKWRLTTLTIKPRFRQKVERMSRVNRKTLYVRIRVRAKVKWVKRKRNGRIVRVKTKRRTWVNDTFHHRYIVRVRR